MEDDMFDKSSLGVEARLEVTGHRWDHDGIGGKAKKWDEV
jgi:hypothetical protein